ncbi:MAG: pilin [Candidatus Paceibacterota bacterium]
MMKTIYWWVIGFLLVPTTLVLGATDLKGEVEGDGSAPFELKNPLQFDTIEKLLAKIIEILVLIGTPIAVVFLIYSGFLFVSARGNEEKITKAKMTFMWTVIGTAILLGASVIANVLEGTISQVVR